MQKTKLDKKMSFIVCIVLIAAMALVTTGCKDKVEHSEKDNSEGISAQEDKNVSQEAEITVLGEGKTKFAFTVTDADGEKTEFQIHTDKKMVGEALQELDLISGEKGPYGLYVKTVNGITVDYEQDGKYWSFYVDGEYAMTGIDATEIVEDSTYAMKVE